MSTSLLHRAGREARRHPRLQRQEQQQRRQRRQRRAGHDMAPLDDVLAEIGGEQQRHRLQLGIGQEGEREQVLRPAEQESVGRRRDDARHHDREDDAPDHLELRAAVDDRRLVQACAARSRDSRPAGRSRTGS